MYIISSLVAAQMSSLDFEVRSILQNVIMSAVLNRLLAVIKSSWPCWLASGRLAVRGMLFVQAILSSTSRDIACVVISILVDFSFTSCALTPCLMSTCSISAVHYRKIFFNISVGGSGFDNSLV